MAEEAGSRGEYDSYNGPPAKAFNPPHACLELRVFIKLKPSRRVALFRMAARRHGDHRMEAGGIGRVALRVALSRRQHKVRQECGEGSVVRSCVSETICGAATQLDRAPDVPIGLDGCRVSAQVSSGVPIISPSADITKLIQGLIQGLALREGLKGGGDQ